MSIDVDVILEAARYIEKRELRRQHGDVALSTLESNFGGLNSIETNTSSAFSLDSGWSPDGCSSNFSETDDRLCHHPKPQTRKRLHHNYSRASGRRSQKSKNHKSNKILDQIPEIYSTIHFDSCDDVVTSSPVLEKEVNSDEHSVDVIIDSLHDEVGRISQSLLEMQSRMSSVCEQIVLSARAHFTECFTEQLNEPFASLSNTSNCSPDVGQDDEVPIGSGKTLIPRHVYNQINWNSYTMATRKLLMAVFPRRTLATHSLTGKASPAFQAKPAKLRLDARKVNDIVMAVVDKCGVREGLVRSCITTKCADENKMYKMRLKKKANRKHSAEDKQNIPPRY